MCQVLELHALGDEALRAMKARSSGAAEAALLQLVWRHAPHHDDKCAVRCITKYTVRSDPLQFSGCARKMCAGLRRGRRNVLRHGVNLVLCITCAAALCARASFLEVVVPIGHSLNTTASEDV